MSVEIKDTDERLLWLLRRAGEEWGPAGVASVAARLAEPTPILYVNHDRAEPAPGDVVRDADNADSPLTWAAWQDGHHGSGWISTRSGIGAARGSLPERLRLLIDGSTGEVVRDA